jgi:hypothetical protein
MKIADTQIFDPIHGTGTYGILSNEDFKQRRFTSSIRANKADAFVGENMPGGFIKNFTGTKFEGDIVERE